MADRTTSARPRRPRIAAIRATLSGLTAQGRSIAAAGVVVAVFAPVLGEKELIQVAVLLVSVPILAAALSIRMRAPLLSRRSTTIRRIPAGRPTPVRLRVDALRDTMRRVRIEDCVPPELDASAPLPGGRTQAVSGDGPRFTLEPMPAGGAAELEYVITPHQRGTYFLGPLTVSLGDPFGMCAVAQPVSGVQRIVVTPTITQLSPNPLVDSRADTGVHRGRRQGGTEDDATVRAYRPGDEPRKVHWRSTARTGELMVRAQEHPRHATATVLLDTRAAAHAGSGPKSSFEWAVSAAASVAAYLAARGLLVTIVTDTGETVTPDSPEHVHTWLDFLAAVPLSGGSGLDFDGTDRPGLSSGVVIGVFGALTGPDVHSLQRLAWGTRVAIAMLLDSASWASAGSLPIMTPPSRGARPDLLGWHTGAVRHDSNVAQVWRTLAPARSGAGILHG